MKDPQLGKVVRGVWRYHATKLLGALSVIIPGLMAIDNLIPKDDQKYWFAANVIVGAFTVRRGFENSKRMK